MELVEIYCDGSYSSSQAVWGFIVYNLEGKELFRDRGLLKGKINSMHQVGGELKSVEEAVRYCKKNNVKAVIFYDFIGLFNWVSDFFINKQPWRCKNEFTNSYREFIKENRIYIEKMVKIKSHSGNKGNDAVDGFCSALWKKSKNEN